MIINRLFYNLNDEEYVDTFFFKGDILKYLLGFNDRVNHESSIFNILHQFGLIPSLLM